MLDESSLFRSIPTFLGFVLLLTVLPGMTTGGPPRFHAVGPNPAEFDQFNFIVLLLSLTAIYEYEYKSIIVTLTFI